MRSFPLVVRLVLLSGLFAMAWDVALMVSRPLVGSVFLVVTTGCWLIISACHKEGIQ